MIHRLYLVTCLCIAVFLFETHACALHGHHGHSHDGHSHDHDHLGRELKKVDDDEPLVQDLEIKEKNGKKHAGVRCAAEHEHKHNKKRDKQEMERVLRELSGRRWLQVQQVPAQPVNLKVKFQVITNSAGQGNVSNTVLLNQMAVLNATYASSKFTFTMDPSRDIVRRVDNTYYTECYNQRDAMRQLWAIDVTRFINVYVCNPGGSILGSSTFPNSPAGENNTRHGVVVNVNSLPGGSFTNFNLGFTLTHEIGHYLGLFHTFQGKCTAAGDSVDDTPAQNTSTYGCPVGKDTCPQAGLDPITNFMDYSDDPCMDQFTRGQALRMHNQTSLFRPTLYYSPSSPTAAPTKSPTKVPTPTPTRTPTELPTLAPTKPPVTESPTNLPTRFPTLPPTKNPTKSPTKFPTEQPIIGPTNPPTSAPTKSPTKSPTREPTLAPTKSPTYAPTSKPTKSPTKSPTKAPTRFPTEAPAKKPTKAPTRAPTKPSPTKPKKPTTLRQQRIRRRRRRQPS